MRSRLEIVSRERIRDELDKLLVLPCPAPGLWFLVNTGLARSSFPSAGTRPRAGPVQRHKDVLAHTSRRREDKSREDFRLSALFHDIGSP